MLYFETKFWSTILQSLSHLKANETQDYRQQFTAQFLSVSISLTELTGFIVVAYIFKGRENFQADAKFIPFIILQFGIA